MLYENFFNFVRFILIRKGIVMNQKERAYRHRKKYFLRFKPFLLILLFLGIMVYLFFDLFNCLIFVFLSTFIYSLLGVIAVKNDVFITMFCIQSATVAPIGLNLILLNVNFISVGIAIFTVSEILTVCYGLKKGI